MRNDEAVHAMNTRTLARQIATAMDESLDTLPPGVETRLRNARGRALARSQREPVFLLRFLPAGAAMAGLAGLLVLLQTRALSPATAVDGLLGEAYETAALDLPEVELVEELDFYAWLARREGQPDAPAG